jgi:hypothetical protein
MAKHRIIRRPSALDPSAAIYEIEESIVFNWWHLCGVFDTFEEAEQRVFNLKKQEQYKVKRQVIRVYD